MDPSIELNKVLSKINDNYKNYDIRYNLVIDAIYFASKCGYKIGFRLDNDLDISERYDWIVVVIHTPDKQISWHMPADKIPYIPNSC
jgi:hypothetical protein